MMLILSFVDGDDDPIYIDVTVSEVNVDDVYDDFDFNVDHTDVNDDDDVVENNNDDYAVVDDDTIDDVNVEVDTEASEIVIVHIVSNDNDVNATLLVVSTIMSCYLLLMILMI